MLRIVYTDRALPGTELAGTNVEGDSGASLRERMTRLKASPVTVFAAGKQLRITPVDAGYEQDVPATVDRVLDEGRDGPLFGLVRTARGLWESHDVQPVDKVDAAKIDATSRRVARLINRVAYPGGITIDPVTLVVDVQGPRRGRTVDRPALKGQLVQALRGGQDKIKVPFKSTPVASAGAVQKVADAADRYLREPLVVTGLGGEPAFVSREQLAKILRLRASRQDRTKVRLGSDEPALIAVIAGIAVARDHPSREPRFSAPARSAIVDGKGKVSWRSRRATVRVVRAGASGRTVDRAKALVTIANAIRAGRHTVKMPVKLDKPKVTPAAAAKVDSLIGTFTTRYEPGQPRVTNIRRMARTLDGRVIAPGAQFDLNGIVGQRTVKGGYVKAPFIADGKIVPSVGGGVSQFSTTMYNAAYFAGLKVDTHQPHSLYISRYPPGREATLDYPGIDLKWTNDTDAPILIRTFTDDRSLTVTLYGDNGGRSVTATPGPREKIPGEDFQITVERTVRYGDGHVAKDSFTTKYDKGAE
jgi:hypothetical protein